MSQNLLLMLQLCNSSLPLGAYSYSEGLETLIEEKSITSADTLNQWLVNELKYGSIRVESAVLMRSYSCYLKQDLEGLFYWNDWFTATRETQELRQQSWQMGKSLCRLIPALVPNNPQLESLINNFNSPCNYAIAFGILTAHWQINPAEVLLGYLHSWLTNLVNVGVKLIPLGQTEGQILLLNLNRAILESSQEIMTLKDDDFYSCSWGLSWASIKHETLYSRLFRS